MEGSQVTTEQNIYLILWIILAVVFAGITGYNAGWHRGFDQRDDLCRKYHMRWFK
jgi:hypothetical protein